MVINEEKKYVCSDRRVIDKRQTKLQHICLQLAALGHKCQLSSEYGYLSVADSLIKNYSQYRRLFAEYRCPADQRIQDFLNNYFEKNDVDLAIKLPVETFSLNEKGMARELSLPLSGNKYKSDLLESYRVK
ncbi:MAG: hypothetical protein OEM07_00275, partial [Gammaproteobacteria bacterium]|nr:hypothetical protein [Gammaproteobacteria bacterium]